MRLFLALELPPEIRRTLGELQRQLRDRCSGWRWVRPEGIHLTLRFLGEVSAEDDSAQRDGWRDAAARSGPLRLRLGGIGVFPGLARPRVLWVGVCDDTPGEGLARLARDLEGAARAAGLPLETRAFRPHLTLARGARGRRPTAPTEPFPVPEVALVSRELALMRSELVAGGARYTRIEAFPFEAG